MSGHSKWSQIKYQKATADLRRGKIFSKLAGAIAAAAKTGGPEPERNIRLRLLLEQARTINMPKDNIERAIKRGSGLVPGVKIEEILYEAYGPFGIALLISATTDNRNRITSAIRSVLNRFGGRLAKTGAVSYLFEQKGILTIKLDGQEKSREEIELKIIDAGAEDFEEQGNLLLVYVEPKKLEQAKQNLQSNGILVSQTRLSFEPKDVVKIEDERQSLQILQFMDALDEIDEVNNIYSNFDISDKILESSYK